jgi:hypothetical protein
MAANKPMGPFGPVVTTIAGATLAVERVNNGWIRRQELQLKQNEYRTNARQIALEREIASQKKQIEHQKFLIAKTAEKREIYGALNDSKITEAQAKILIKDLDESSSNKPVAVTQPFHMPEAPLIKFESRENIKQKPFLATVSYSNFNNKLEFQISEKKSAQILEENSLENQEFKLLELEPYPLGEIVCAAIFGGLAGLAFYSVLINVIYRVKNYLSKKK